MSNRWMTIVLTALAVWSFGQRGLRAVEPSNGDSTSNESQGVVAGDLDAYRADPTVSYAPQLKRELDQIETHVQHLSVVASATEAEGFERPGWIEAASCRSAWGWVRTRTGSSILRTWSERMG